MVNKNEQEIIRKYEAEGWKTVRGGAPDFLFLKVEDGKITDALFVEVKANGDKLSYAQGVFRKVLERLGAEYRVEHVSTHVSSQVQSKPAQSVPPQAMPSQARPVHTRPCHSTPRHTNPKP